MRRVTALRSLRGLAALAAAALAACAGDDGASATADPCALDMNTPGSQCIKPERFDFEPSEVDLEGELAGMGVTFEPPADGFQLTTQGVRLLPGEDDEFCEAFEVPADADDPDREYCVTRVEVAMTDGFHHLFVAKAEVGSESEALMELGRRARCVGGAHVVYGSELQPIPLPQGKYVDAKYYQGVGVRFAPRQKISVNYHYLNVGDEDAIAVTKLNFHAVPCEGLLEMGQFGFYNQDIAVPPHGSASTRMSATFSQDVYVLDLFRHTHRVGTNVPISFYKGPRDGELIYDSPDYETGASFQFEEPVLVRKGEGFTFVCNFDNPRDRWVRFGPTADDEMCMLLGTAWTADPAVALRPQHRYKWAQ